MTAKRLPRRWHKLRYHREQVRLLTEDKRFCVVVAGRRSGKTELAKRKLVYSLIKPAPWNETRYFAAAPTRDQAKRIFWKDLKALVPPDKVRRIYESDLCIVTKNACELWVTGLDRPQRIEGTPWDGGVLDEYANMRPFAWTENVRPGLSDRQGWCWFVGVPEGFNHFMEIAQYARSGVDPDWGFYSWFSADILPAREVEAARRELDPRTFRQEYEASFESKTGVVYYAFDSALHIDPATERNPGLPVIICCDFNVDPCIWELAQNNGRDVCVFDEINLRDTNTVEMGRELLSRYRTHRAGFIVYGDSAGAARSTTGSTDYALLRELGLIDQRVMRANPAVKDRVNVVNSMLKSTRGEVRIKISPRCTQLKRDFETVTWRYATGEIDKTDPARTHASDALGYYLTYEFPLKALKADPSKIFYK